MKKTLLTLFTFLLVLSSTAQDAEIQKRYWQMRDRLKKQHLKIGTEPGESIPFHRRIGVKGGRGFPLHCPDNPDSHTAVTNPTDLPYCESFESSLNFGADATIDIGWYIFMLANEYKNLNDGGQDGSETLIELWYAISVLNRLDIDAEEYLSNETITTNSSHLNGLLMRDDVPELFYENWLDKTVDRYGNPVNITGQGAKYSSVWWDRFGTDDLINYRTWDGDTEMPVFPDVNNIDNVQSQDQLISIVTGLVGVKKMVPENTQVLIPETGATVDFHEIIHDIAERIENRLDAGKWQIIDWDGTGPAGTSGGHTVGANFTSLKKAFRIIRGITPSSPNYGIEIQAEDEQEILLGRIIVPESGSVAGWASSLGYFPGTSIGDIKMSGEQMKFFWNQMEAFQNNWNINAIPFNVGDVFEPSPFFEFDISFKIDGINALNGDYQVVGYYDSDQNKFHITYVDVPPGFVAGMVLSAHVLPLTLSVAIMTAISPVFSGVNAIFDTQLPTAGDLVDLLELGLNIAAYNFEDTFGMVNVHMGLESATYSQAWGYDYIMDNAEISDLPHYALMWKVLHENSDNNIGYGWDKNFYLNKIAQLPCEGPWADPYAVYDPDSSNPNTDAISLGWACESAFHKDPIQANIGWMQTTSSGDLKAHSLGRGEFNGLDWLVYYNMYYSLWKDEIEAQGVQYKRDIECNCVHDIVDENVADISYPQSGIPTFDGTQKTLEAFFPDYNDKGIYSPNILSRELNIDNAAQINLRNDLLMCLPTGATPYALTVRSGSVLDLKDDHVIDVCEGCEIRVQAGADLIMSGTGSKIIFKEGGKLILESGATLTTTNGNVIELNNGELVVDILSSIYLNNESSIHANGTTNVQLINSNIVADASSSVYFGEGSTVYSENFMFDLLNGSSVEFDGESVYNTENTDYICSGGSYLRLKENAIWFWSNDNILNLTGAESRLELGGHVDFEDDTHFTFNYDGTESGYIRLLSEGHPDDRFTSGANCEIHLEGEGKDDLILYLEEDANFWNSNNDLVVNGQSFSSESLDKLEIRNGYIAMDTDSRVVANANFEMHNVHVDGGFDATGTIGNDMGVEVFDQNLIVNCDFTYSALSGNFVWADEILRVYNSNFEESPIRVSDQGFRIDNCDFEGNMGIYSEARTVPSYVTNCFFTDLNMAIQDVSKAELILNDNIILNTQIGVQNDMGKMSLECNNFNNNNLAIAHGYGVLNLSIHDRAGYNQFSSNDKDIHLIDAQEIVLEDGYNSFNFSNTNPLNIYGNIAQAATPGTLVALNGANNYWNNWSADNGFAVPGPEHGSAGNWKIDLIMEPTNVFDPPRAHIQDLGNISGTCGEYDGDYGTIPGRKSLKGKKGGKEEVGNSTKNSADSIPIIFTNDFQGWALDSAIVFAVSNMEMVDSTMNDALAIDLFHQILTFPLDSINEDTDYILGYAYQNMRATLGNLFLSKEITKEDNLTDFHPLVWNYVDVLMAMTDEEISLENYNEQFYLEMDKAHMFRQIGNTWMSYQLLDNLDNCPLDSAEQNILNNWLTIVETEIIQEQMGMEWLLVDSNSIEIDSTWYNLPMPSPPNSSNFGANILGLNTVTYTNCGLIDFKTDEALDIDLSLYPNPGEGVFNLEINNVETKKILFQIYDMKGSLIYSDRINPKKGIYRFDLSSYESGIYLFNLLNDDLPLGSGKIILQK